MKNVVALLALVGVLSFSSVSYAQIEKKVDSFDGTIRIHSVQQNIGDFAQFNFVKVIDIEKNASLKYLQLHMF